MRKLTEKQKEEITASIIMLEELESILAIMKDGKLRKVFIKILKNI